MSSRADNPGSIPGPTARLRVEMASRSHCDRLPIASPRGHEFLAVPGGSPLLAKDGDDHRMVSVQIELASAEWLPGHLPDRVDFFYAQDV